MQASFSPIEQALEDGATAAIALEVFGRSIRALAQYIEVVEIDQKLAGDHLRHSLDQLRALIEGWDER